MKTYTIEHNLGSASSVIRVFDGKEYIDGATADGGDSADRFDVLYEWVAERHPSAEPRHLSTMEIGK